MNAFSRRRARFMRAIGPDSIAIIPTAPVSFRNRDVDYPFRPDSDFFYLTEFPEPEAVAVITTPTGRRRGVFILFCRDRDAEKETWEGRRVGQQGAVSLFGADEAYSITQMDEMVPELMENKARVFYGIGKDPGGDRQLMDWRNRVSEKARAGIHAPTEIIAIEKILHEMRLRKDRSEIAIMRRAAKISAHAHRRAMSVCRPGMTEYQIEAELLHEFKHNGSHAPAYSSIVGGGENGCILHYTENGAELNSGDLLLIDAGAELDCYASDITRTFPVNGSFSAPQRAVYEVVLAAQEAAIKKVRPGNRWNEPHDAAVRSLTKGLIKLGILKGSLATSIKKQAYRRFYMHRTGHWLGMDVHDVGEYRVDGKWRRLEPGMVLTVEPGLYIPAGSKGVAKKWWNIGIRIEDDVLVTPQGCEVLSIDAPKSVAAIESLMAKPTTAHP